MNTYLDASVLVSALIQDDHTERAKRLTGAGMDLALSRWTLAEASSAFALNLRIGRLNASQHAEAERKLDGMIEGNLIEQVLSTDFDAARKLVRRQANLRAPDALHLAIVQRTRLTLATFDRRLADAARQAGVAVADI